MHHATKSQKPLVENNSSNHSNTESDKKHTQKLNSAMKSKL